MFTLARQRPRALIGLVGTALFLTGCAGSGTTTTETVTVTEATPSGDSSQAETAQDSASSAAPATFDRNDPNFEFFNICEELTNEDLAEVGLMIDDANPAIDLSIPMSNCGFTRVGGFDTSAYGIQYAVMSMGVSADKEFAQQVDFYDGFDESVLPGIKYFSPKGESSERSCDVAVPTENGRLWVTYGTVRRDAMPHKDICAEAADYLKRIRSAMENQR